MLKPAEPAVVPVAGGVTETDGRRFSARWGTPPARRVGNVFYDLESNRPLYVEEFDAQPALAPDGNAE